MTALLRFRPLLIAIVSLIAAALLLMQGIARASERRGNGLLALALSSDPATRGIAAEQLLAIGQTVRAKSLATQALIGNPLDVRALRVLGLAEEKLGNPQRTLELLGLGGRLSWRDSPTQAWLFRTALLNQDFEAVAQRGDALLRRNQQPEEVFRVFALISSIPAARASLVSRLSDDPAWRTAYFLQLGSMDPRYIPGQVLMVRAMRDTPAPANQNELRPWLLALVEQGQGQIARALWIDLFARGTAGRAIDDGGFDATDAQAATEGLVVPFQWRFHPENGLFADLDQPSDGTRNRALLIEAGGAGKGLVASQVTTLPPGSYRLGARVMTDRGVLAGRLGIVARCYGGGVLGTAKLMSAVNREWREIGTQFAVPARDCVAQQIQILVDEGPGPSAAAAWIDDVAIVAATSRGGNQSTDNRLAGDETPQTEIGPP